MASTNSVLTQLVQLLNLSDKYQAYIGTKEAELCLKITSENDIAEFTRELLWQKVLSFTRLVVVPEFWSKFIPADSEAETFEKFCVAVGKISDQVKELQRYFTLIDKLARNASPLTYELYKTHLASILLSQIPKDFESVILSFYSRCFHAFNHQEKSTGSQIDQDDSADASSDILTDCLGCEQEIDNCKCSLILQECQSVNRELAELGILEKLSVGTIHTHLLVEIQSHVQKRCADNFTVCLLEDFEKWLQAVIFKWLAKVYGEEYTLQDQVRKNFAQFLYHAYAHSRIEQLFEIIISYPESFPAVKDLQECLSRTQLKSVLTESLKSTLEARLLHQGASTEDILIAYVSAIRVFSVLDPTGVLLDVACEPIKLYLRNRDDTVRHIIHSLTDSSGDLGGELELGRVSSMDDDSSGLNTEGEPSNDWENWMPAPSDADPSKIWTGKKPGDIVPMLVSIYGSKSLFVKEYRKLLSDRLLSNLHFDTEEEIRNLEFLKIRFGENELHNCEVMLKDVADSKRTNTTMQSIAISSRPKFPISALVISAQYWDQLKEKPMKLPTNIVEQLDRYTENYTTVKSGRTLHWVPQSGSVELDLEFDSGRTVSFLVPPDLATIISLFEDKEQWSLEELSQQMELPMSHLRRRVHVWQMQGVLVEVSPDRFQVDKRGPSFNGQKVLLESLAKPEQEEDDDEDGEETEKKSEDDGLQIYWSYVVGMLTNLEALPVERIHQMLKMFTMQGSDGSECTLQQLKAFLDSKVCVDSLESARNAYKGGAHRLELCSSLSLGGLTPTTGLVNAVKTHVSIPAFAMIRPRDGDFVYDEDELAVMEEDIKALKERGVDGFVFGVLNSDGSVDQEACRRLLRLAKPLPCTFHRAFDVIPNPMEVLEEIIQLGFHRILTSGQRESALAGSDLIAQLQQKADSRIVIMAGAGITDSNAATVWSKTKVTEIHGSAAYLRPAAGPRNSVNMGTGPETCQKRVTSTEIVERIVKSLTICSKSAVNH